jgi:hypothetical protein
LKLSRLAGAGIGLALAAAPAAQAYDIDFRGQSRTSPKLKADLLANIAGYAKSRYQCAFPFSVETSLLPATYMPRTAMYRISSPQRSYERWLVNLCGTKRPFLVGLWPDAKGGAYFKVGEIMKGVEP